jgi:uncharacterized repeat protein (TIGR04138 family)
MHTANFDEGIDQIAAKDSRYHKEAYHFVREALDYTQGMLKKGGKGESRPAATGEEVLEGGVRHVSGQQLLEGIRAYALEQFGPMTFAVLAEWGVHRCEDFGELVFTMVESNLLAKTKKDSREDFKGGYDFDAAFRQPFLPSKPKAAPAIEVGPTEVS